MNRLRCTALLATLLAVASACDEAAAPEGESGTITVRAYVDADASGTVTAGDVPVSGLTVTLSSGGTDIATAQTATDGSATFDDVAPGSYRVRATGAVPEGAILVSNPEPSAVVSFQGAPAEVELQFAFLPASISGRVARVADDVGAENVRVALIRAGTTDTVATTTTSATGAYEFELLPAGDYTLEFEEAGAIDYGVEGNTRDVSLTAGEDATMDVPYTGSIFITVAEARLAALGTRVAVIADVTVPAGQFTSGTGGVNSEIWVQDATGGISVFSVPTANASLYQIGQRLEVVGVTGSFSGQEQIQGNAQSPLVVRQRTGGVIHPPKTIIAAVARTLVDEGRLVRVPDLEVTAIGTPSMTTGSFNVTTISPTGDQLVLRIAGFDTEITADMFAVGSTYTITGVLTQNGSTPQVKVRFPSDIGLQSGPPPNIIINEFMANPDKVADAAGEYIELYNAGSSPVDLQNWTIRDAFPNSFTINQSLIVPAGGYVVLGLNSNTSQNGGVTVDFVYAGNVSLNQGGDDIVLLDPLGVVVDQVTYPGTAAAPGISMGVIDPAVDNSSTATNWMAQTSTYGLGDRGTPRARNDGWLGPLAAVLRSGRIER